MSFKPVPTQKKIEAVSRVVAGKMSATARKVGFTELPYTSGRKERF